MTIVKGLSLDPLVSTMVIAYVLMAFAFDMARKRSEKVDAMLRRAFPPDTFPRWFRLGFMGAMSVVSILLYFYCWWCDITGEGNDGGRSYLHIVFRDLMGILPWFIWGCILAGFVLMRMGQGRLKLPRDMLSAGAFASVIPICSCAAVPLAHGMMLGKQMRLRAVIVFLIVVPVLSPVVMVMALGRIGWWYLLSEVIAVFILAIVAGVVIERFAGLKEAGDARAGCYTCEGCSSSHLHARHDHSLLYAWDQFLYLLRFILLGILIGAAIAVYVDATLVMDWFGGGGDFLSGIPGLVAIVLVGIPIFICSGEDVVILAPLLAKGLPLGHAIAFAISGNAICVTSVPVLNATFGRKVTVMVFASFFVGCILLGLAINAVVALAG